MNENIMKILICLGDDNINRISKLHAKKLVRRNVILTKTELIKIYDKSVKIDENVKNDFFETLKETLHDFKIYRTTYLKKQIKDFKKSINELKEELTEINSIEL